MADELATRVRDALRAVPDFPQPGVLFRDITPLLAASNLFPRVVAWLAEQCEGHGADRVACIESRGFLFGAPLAERLGLPLALIRKPGKLPYRKVSESYTLEYGVGTIEMHVDALAPGERVLVVDDLIATGGTAAASCVLVERLGGVVAGCCFVVELDALGGRSRLDGRAVHTLLRFD